MSVQEMLSLCDVGSHVLHYFLFLPLSCIQCVSMLQDNPHYVQPPPPGCPRAVYQQIVLCW